MDNVLATAATVLTDVTHFRQEAEEAFNKWELRSHAFEDGVRRATEMKDWGHPQAPALTEEQ